MNEHSDQRKFSQEDAFELFKRNLLFLKCDGGAISDRIGNINERLELHRRWLASDGNDGARFEPVNENLMHFWKRRFYVCHASRKLDNAYPHDPV